MIALLSSKIRTIFKHVVALKNANTFRTCMSLIVSRLKVFSIEFGLICPGQVLIIQAHGSL